MTTAEARGELAEVSLTTTRGTKEMMQRCLKLISLHAISLVGNGRWKGGDKCSPMRH